LVLAIPICVRRFLFYSNSFSVCVDAINLLLMPMH
jgi:hypothetical protein